MLRVRGGRPGDGLRMIAHIREWLWRGGWSPLLEAALVVVLAACLAYWTWVVVAPRPVAAPPLADHARVPSSGPIVKRGLFGAAPDGAPHSAPGAGASAKLRLTGIVAPRAPESGGAVFRLESGKSATVRPGEAIVPGVVLKEVHPDHVVVARDGAPERMALDRRAASVEQQAGARRKPAGRDAGK